METKQECIVRWGDDKEYGFNWPDWEKTDAIRYPELWLAISLEQCNIHLSFADNQLSCELSDYEEVKLFKASFKGLIEYELLDELNEDTSIHDPQFAIDEFGWAERDRDAFVEQIKYNRYYGANATSGTNDASPHRKA